MNPNPEQLSPESQKRRNKGKIRRDCVDESNREMCDRSASAKHNTELAKAGKLGDSDTVFQAVQKEHQRHEQYTLGQNSASPMREP